MRPKHRIRPTHTFAVLIGLTTAVVHADATPGGMHLTLEQAINLGLSNNATLKVASSHAEAIGAGVPLAQSAFLPTLAPLARTEFSGGGNITMLGVQAQQSFLTGTRLVGSAFNETESGNGSSSDRLGSSIQLEQSIFRNAGELTQGQAIASAKFESRAAQRQFELQRAALVIDIVGKYTDLQQRQHQAASDQLSVDRNDLLRRRVAAKESVGRASRLDTLRAELVLGQARGRLENDSARLAASRRALAELIGVPLKTEFELESPAYPDYATPAADEALRTATSRRLELQQAREDSEFAERSLRVARRDLLPDLRLVVGYRDNAPLSANTGGGSGASDGVFFGVSTDTDFNRTRARYRVEQARLNAQSVEQNIETTRTAIERDVGESLQEFAAAKVDVQLAQANLEYARGRLELAQRLFELGRADTFEVTNAEEQFQQVESQVLGATARLTKAGYGISRALGTLVESGSSRAASGTRTS